MRKVVIASEKHDALDACPKCLYAKDAKNGKVCQRFQPTEGLEYEQKKFPSGCRSFYRK